MQKCTLAISSYSHHKISQFTHSLTNLHLFWFRKVKVYIALSTKMGDKSQVELIPYLMKEPLKLPRFAKSKHVQFLLQEKEPSRINVCKSLTN